MATVHCGSFSINVKSSKTEQIHQWQQGANVRQRADELAVEEPLEIRVDNHPISVTMRTPGHDAELAAGFLVSEGLIKSAAQIHKIEPHPRNPANVVNVFLAPDVSINLKQLTRHVFASSSCGLCGKATIDAVRLHFPRSRSRAKVSAEMLLQLPERLRQAQATFERTGGLHAAAVFDLSGKLLVLREDVGRHNAVDKVLGHGLLHGLLPFSRHILMVSGRASFEIMQKALAASLPIVCAVSAPSTLAVDFAREGGQTLVGFLRGNRMNIYSRPDRLEFLK